jgi:hypothetical protein
LGKPCSPNQATALSLVLVLGISTVLIGTSS